MKKKESLDKPRIRGLRVLYIGVAAIWLVATLGGYKESKREKFDLSVKPGAVTYGTHSAPLIPMVSISSRRTTLPIVSGDEVRSYARYGYASMPDTGYNSYRSYHPSYATSRPSGARGTMGSSGGRSYSPYYSTNKRSNDYNKSATLSLAFDLWSISRSVPSRNGSPADLAMNTGPRRVNPHAGETGSEGDKYQDTENPNLWWYWSEDEEDWISGNPPVGTVKEVDGIYYEWNGMDWVVKGQVSDLGAPVGDTPWIWMILLAAAYILTRRTRCKEK